MKKSSSTNKRQNANLVPQNLDINLNFEPVLGNNLYGNKNKPPINPKTSGGNLHSKPFNSVTTKNIPFNNSKNISTTNQRTNSASKNRVPAPNKSNYSYKNTSAVGSKKSGGYSVTNSNVGNISNKPMSKNAYNYNKEGGSEVDTEMDDEKNAQLAEVWKVFGRETDAGKALWRTYAAGNKKKVYYPNVATKPWDCKEALKIIEKPCPQKTVIEYPPTFTKAGIARAKMMSKYHPIDFIQHRKPREEIMHEQRTYYAIVDVPINRAVDRDKMIDDLQEKFRYSKPKRNNKNQELYDQIDPIQQHEDEKKIAYAAEAMMRNELKKGYFGADKPGDKPMVAIRKPIINSNDDLIEIKKQQSKDLINELGDIFDAVVTEIDERQQYMMEVQEMGADDLVDKTRIEIVERVAELQKITRLMNEEKAKLKVLE